MGFYNRHIAADNHAKVMINKLHIPYDITLGILGRIKAERDATSCHIYSSWF